MPHVLAITRGSTVDFPNDDPIFHNVFSLSSAATLRPAAATRAGRAAARRFTKAGIVKVYCNIHSHMSATILVLDNPYFTIPALDGTLRAAERAARRVHRWSAGTSASANGAAACAWNAARPRRVDLSLPVEDPQ